MGRGEDLLVKCTSRELLYCMIPDNAGLGIWLVGTVVMGIQLHQMVSVAFSNLNDYMML